MRQDTATRLRYLRIATERATGHAVYKARLRTLPRADALEEFASLVTDPPVELAGLRLCAGLRAIPSVGPKKVHTALTRSGAYEGMQLRDIAAQPVIAQILAGVLREWAMA